MSTQAAKDEMLAILEGIAAQRGVAVALGAAGSLQRAMEEGRINGHCYRMLRRPSCACVIGHLAMALGWTGLGDDGLPNMGLPDVPGWWKNPMGASPVERWVQEINVGETVHSSTALRQLNSWVTAWMAQQRALPGDAADHAHGACVKGRALDTGDEGVAC